MTGAARQQRLPAWVSDAALTLAAGALIASTLGLSFLNSPNWPTGGDTASHLLYAWLYAGDLLAAGDLTAWLPEVFAGLPFLSYYFPLPFLVIAALSKFVGLAPAFKWGAFLAAMALPGAIFVGSRRWLGFSALASLFAALGAVAFLLHEQNSIWGGNLLSTLAGEFAYSYGLLFALLAMLAWVRAAHRGGGWVLAAVLEAASGYSHGFPLLVVGTSTALLLAEHWQAGARGRVFVLLLKGHLLAFCLLGGWLWPMLEMHGLTIANDASFPVTGWRELLPATLWPIVALGVAGAAALGLTAVRRCWGDLQWQALRYLLGAAGIAAVAFIAGDQLGLADIRFFPMVWLLAAVACGWLFGQALAALDLPLARRLAAAALAAALLGWFAQQVRAAPDWALWNHSGLDAKPQWQNLARLFPLMEGELWSPRLLFEHDPANNDIGSTRSLEALPMFLGHRPVLEGLYMESALLGPAIYQLQSEVSARPSSPLVRFPSGSLDPQFAARHMNALHADTLLLRSREAQAAMEASGLFEKLGAAPPFALYRLKDFDSQLVEVLRRPLRWLPQQDWMQDAFAWFRTRSRFEAYQPVYGQAPPQRLEAPAAAAKVRTLGLSRHELLFETDAVGQAHLIKMAYHPRWQLASPGELFVAAPGFMLVIPAGREIRLVYGHTLVGKLGMGASLAAVLVLAGLFVRRRHLAGEATGCKPPARAAVGRLRLLPLLAAWLLLAAAAVYFALHAPERVYNQAWEAMRAARHAEAADAFAQALALRRPPAKKEEALFWAAKASELAGRHAEAEARYQQLVASYHGYWVPESLHQIVVLERQFGRAEQAEPFIMRLRQEYPNNRWTLKLATPPQ